MHVDHRESLASTLADAGFGRPAPVIVVVGGASGMDAGAEERLEALAGELAGLAARVGAVVVDGGTDAGVMRLLGAARLRGASFPLVGVAVAALVGGGEGRTPLEPHHTIVLLVPGRQWGEESPWLAETATVIAGGSQSVTVLVNGGETAYADVDASVVAGRPVVVAAGSGRTADAIAAAARGHPGDARATDLLESGHVRVVETAQLAHEVERALTR